MNHVARSGPQVGGRPFSRNLPMSSVSGPVTLADGSRLLNGFLTFNSLVPQLVSGQMIQPLIVSASTDSDGDMAISLPQGLMVQITVSDHGVTYPPMNAIIPLLNAIAFDQLPHLNMVTGVPEAPNYNGPWARSGTSMTWVPTVSAPSQTSGNLAYNPVTSAWSAVYPPGTTDPAGAVSYPGGHVVAWDPDTSQWCQVYLPAVTQPPASNALAWDSNMGAWVSTVWNPPYAGVSPGTYGWYTDGNGNVAWHPVASQTGVTDGSAAAAGQIGECVVANNQVNALAGYTTQNYTTIAQTTLQPGDWDISALVSLIPVAASTAAMMMGWAYFSTVPGAPNMGPGNYILLSNAFVEGGTTNVGPQQFNIAVATTLYVTAWVMSPSAADNNLAVMASAFIHARRMR